MDASLWPSLFEHKLLPYSLLAFAAIMYVPALGWEFLASTRLTSELNFLLQEIDNCYHRAAEGRAPKIEKQIQSKGPGITEREKREIIENAEKEKSPEQNLFEKYLERRGRSNFLAKLYLARHLLILLLSVAPISYLCTYYATQKQNEFTCALGASPDGPAGGPGTAVRVSCKLPSVQLQRIVAGVDIVLLCAMNLIILVNLIHLFIFRKSNFIFDKLHKVGIKTRRQWRGSQFCDINILAMFCNENRDHIKSLNRLDFITNESDLMYDNVVRQLLAALAQSNHDVTPTVRNAGVQTVDPSADPAEPEGAAEPPVVKRPRKKMKWIPSSNPLPQPFKEQLAIMRVENSKTDKPKPVRRKTATDTLIAPLLDAGARATHHYKGSGGDAGPAPGPPPGPDKKQARHFSLDVHPYILGTKKAKPEAVPAALPVSRSQEGGFLSQAEECGLGLAAAPTKGRQLGRAGGMGWAQHGAPGKGGPPLNALPGPGTWDPGERLRSEPAGKKQGGRRQLTTGVSVDGPCEVHRMRPGPQGWRGHDREVAQALEEVLEMGAAALGGRRVQRVWPAPAWLRRLRERWPTPPGTFHSQEPQLALGGGGEGSAVVDSGTCGDVTACVLGCLQTLRSPRRKSCTRQSQPGPLFPLAARFMSARPPPSPPRPLCHQLAWARRTP